MTDLALLAAVLRAVEENDREALERYVREGGDLTGIGDNEREVIARLLGGKSPRRRGQKISDRKTKKRNELIRARIAFEMGRRGLPAYTDSGGGKPDACSLVAEQENLSAERVRKIWTARRDSATRDWIKRLGQGLAKQKEDKQQK